MYGGTAATAAVVASSSTSGVVREVHMSPLLLPYTGSSLAPSTVPAFNFKAPSAYSPSVRPISAPLMPSELVLGGNAPTPSPLPPAASATTDLQPVTSTGRSKSHDATPVSAITSRSKSNTSGSAAPQLSSLAQPLSTGVLLMSPAGRPVLSPALLRAQSDPSSLSGGTSSTTTTTLSAMTSPASSTPHTPATPNTGSTFTSTNVSPAAAAAGVYQGSSLMTSIASPAATSVSGSGPTTRPRLSSSASQAEINTAIQGAAEFLRIPSRLVGSASMLTSPMSPIGFSSPGIVSPMTTTPTATSTTSSPNGIDRVSSATSANSSPTSTLVSSSANTSPSSSSLTIISGQPSSSSSISHHGVSGNTESMIDPQFPSFSSFPPPVPPATPLTISTMPGIVPATSSFGPLSPGGHAMSLPTTPVLPFAPSTPGSTATIGGLGLVSPTSGSSGHHRGSLMGISVPSTPGSMTPAHHHGASVGGTASLINGSSTTPSASHSTATSPWKTRSKTLPNALSAAQIAAVTGVAAPSPLPTPSSTSTSSSLSTSTTISITTTSSMIVPSNAPSLTTSTSASASLTISTAISSTSTLHDRKDVVTSSHQQKEQRARLSLFSRVPSSDHATLLPSSHSISVPTSTSSNPPSSTTKPWTLPEIRNDTRDYLTANYGAARSDMDMQAMDPNFIYMHLLDCSVPGGSLSSVTSNGVHGILVCILLPLASLISMPSSS
jgi:hypothetical protein